MLRVPASPPSLACRAPLADHRAPWRTRTQLRAVRFAPRASRRCACATRFAPLRVRHALASSRPLSCALRFHARCARFSRRQTLAAFAWNIRVLLCYSVLLSASENADLVTKLVNSNFRYEVSRARFAPKSRHLFGIASGEDSEQGRARLCDRPAVAGD
jgi:hypothetical protein